MQEIDAHCHLWRLDRGDYGWMAGEGLAAIRRDFLLEDWPGQGRMIAVQAAPTLAETQFLLSLAERDARIAAVVGWVDLASPGAERDLGAIAVAPKLCGIRPMLQDIAATDWLIEAPQPEVWPLMAELGLCLDALVTARHLPMLSRFARLNPDLALVVDHCAKPEPGLPQSWREGMAAMAAVPHVHCKLSGLLTEFAPADLRDPLPRLREVLDMLLGWFGPSRLIWGSDWPVLTLAASYPEWRALTEELLAPLSPAERAAILGGNAQRFYGVAP